MAPRKTVDEHGNGRPVEKVVFYRRPPKAKIDKPFACTVCHSRFSKTYYLRLHEMLHTGERPFKCDICGKGFRMRWRVTLHRRIHTGEKPYACTACDFRANRKDNIRGHMRRKHGDVIYAGEADGRTAPIKKLHQVKKRKIKTEPKGTSQDMPSLTQSHLVDKNVKAVQSRAPRSLKTLKRKPSKIPVTQQLTTVLVDQQFSEDIKPIFPLGTTISEKRQPRKRGRGRPRGRPKRIHNEPKTVVTPVIKKEPEENMNRPIQPSMEPFGEDHTVRPKIENESDGTDESSGRPRRAAANMSYIRLLSILMDEEDIKKEIEDEPQKCVPCQVRRRSDAKQSDEVPMENEEVVYDPPEVWITDEDLIFTEGDVLKFEEDIELLDGNASILEDGATSAQ